MELGGQEVPRGIEARGEDWAVHRTDYRGGDGIFDKGWDEKDQEVHDECNDCTKSLMNTMSDVCIGPKSYI